MWGGKMIRKISFEIETITPMFLAGADQSKAELRAASIKGLLRFWWRALQAESTNLLERESKIFGCSDEKIGGSSFSIRILQNGIAPITIRFPNKDNIHKIMVTSKSRSKTFPINILEYLAYGPFDPKAKKLRPCIGAGVKFNLTIAFHDDSYITDIFNALHCFSLFGGMGSRSRNGFGSFSITKTEGNVAGSIEMVSPTTKYSGDFMKKLFHRGLTIQPYPSFTQGLRIYCTKQLKNTWDEALADVGKIYRDIRIGDKKLNGSVFESKHNYQKRQYLGAPLDPHQEHFNSFLDRHAKPYFMKVAKEGTQYRSYILYLPSLYCDGLEEDRNKRKITNHVALDRNFTEVCNEFNNFLAEQMESII
jgi:CRISPR-associated protein Cmr1